MDRTEIEDMMYQVIQSMREIHGDVDDNFVTREDLQDAATDIGVQVIEESGIDFSNDELADEHYPLLEIMVLITSFLIYNPELNFDQINPLLWAFNPQVRYLNNWVIYFEGSGEKNLKKFFNKIKQFNSKILKNKKIKDVETRKKHLEDKKQKEKTQKERHRAIAKKEQEKGKNRKNNKFCKNDKEMILQEDIEDIPVKDLTFIKFGDSIFCLDNSSYANSLKYAQKQKVRGNCKNKSDEAREAGLSLKCQYFYPINIGQNIFINEKNYKKLLKQVKKSFLNKNPIKQRKLIFKNKTKVNFTTNLHIIGEKTGMGDAYDLVPGKYDTGSYKMKKKGLFGGNPNKKRSFSVVRLAKRNEKDKSKIEGRYIARDAIGAAKKAFNRECRQSRIKGQCTLIIILKETTSGSKKKRYVYKMKRIKLQKPIKIDRNNESITINYKTNARRIKQLNHKEFLKKVKGGSKMSGGGKDALTGFYNIIGNDVILHTDYFIYPEIRSEEGVYKDIMKRHKKEFKKSGIKNISIELHEVMLYPKSEGRQAIKEAMDSQLPLVRESMNMLNKYEVQERSKDAFDFSDISKMLDNL